MDSGRYKRVQKKKKLAKFSVDILSVFKSDNKDPIPIEKATSIIKEKFGSKDAPPFEKCIMVISHSPDQPYEISLQSRTKNKVLETFSIKSMEVPILGELITGATNTISLIYMPVLNSDSKWELFVFHPNGVPAQDVVIRLTRLIQSNQGKLNSDPLEEPRPASHQLEDLRSASHDAYPRSVSHHDAYPQSGSRNVENPRSVSHHDAYPQSGSRYVEYPQNSSNHPFSPHAISPGTTLNHHSEVVNGGQSRDRDPELDGSHSIYSLSSTFINTWQAKVDNIIASSNSSIMGNSNQHSDLFSLNRNLKEIRQFMNELFDNMKHAVREREQTQLYKQNGRKEFRMELPSRSRFEEIIHLIKQSINICADNESMIYNPTAVDIVGQLFLFLRILGDATLNRQNGRPDLVASLRKPDISSNATRFMHDHLTPENKYYWSMLGPNFGYNKNTTSSVSQDAGVIDEFSIRREFITPDSERRNIGTTTQMLLESPKNKSMDDLDMLYRSFPQQQPSQQPPVVETKPVHRSTELDQYHRQIVHTSPMRMAPPPQTNGYVSDGGGSDYVEPRHHHRHKQHQHHKQLAHSHRQSPSILPRPMFVDCHTHGQHSSSWNDRQCRFIDSVLLRNGRLAKATMDRVAKTHQELNITTEEVVEIVADVRNPDPDRFLTVKNAFGEVGICPLSSLEPVQYR